MKRLLSIVVSLLILVAIYWKIDLSTLIQVFQTSNGFWMSVSLAMVVPITLLTSWRLQQLMPTARLGERSTLSFVEANEQKSVVANRLTFAEANRLILVASSLNMVLPSKMGDIAKAYFLRDRGHLSGSLSLSLVIFEKACDLLSLLLWCSFGLLLYPQKDWLFWLMTASVGVGLLSGGLLLSSRAIAQSFFYTTLAIAPKKLQPKLANLQTAWREMHDYFWRDRAQLWLITATSIFIWFLHLLQIWLFILALNAWTPFVTNLALSPLAILAGLLPLTFAGVGTRDAALILFYQPYFSAATAAALGVLCTSRYLMPAIAGLPFLNAAIATLRQAPDRTN